MRHALFATVWLWAGLGAAEAAAPVTGAPLPGEDSYARKITARTYNSGFELAHDTYNGMATASDGRIFYVLCSESMEIGGQMYCLDPRTRQVRHVGDLTEACGEKGRKTVVQGKSHVNFIESNGKLYLTTHLGYYSLVNGQEVSGVPPEGSGWQPYPGGHILAYDLKTGRFDDLGLAPNREGIITWNMDVRRGRMFALTWPSGHFLRFDLASKEWRDFGLVSGQGEAGQGETYRTICRSIAVNPEDGAAYFTASTGEIFRYNPAADSMERVQGEDMKKDYFGLYDPTSAGHMGYNWRQTAWRPMDRSIYGVHGNSGYLFRFDPAAVRMEVLERITSLPSRASGMFDQFSYGYLGFALGPDGNTLYYLTGGPIYVSGRRVAGKDSTAMGEAKGLENLHVITYNIRRRQSTDHGPVFYQNGDRPLYCNSLAIGRDGTIYTLARITENGRTRADLVEIPNPLRSSR